MGHQKSKNAEYRTVVLVQNIAEFPPLQTDTKIYYPIAILFTLDIILSNRRRK